MLFMCIPAVPYTAAAVCCLISTAAMQSVRACVKPTGFAFASLFWFIFQGLAATGFHKEWNDGLHQAAAAAAMDAVLPVPLPFSGSAAATSSAAAALLLPLLLRAPLPPLLSPLLTWVRQLLD